MKELQELRLKISRPTHAEARKQATLAGLHLRDYYVQVLEEAIERRRLLMERDLKESPPKND